MGVHKIGPKPHGLCVMFQSLLGLRAQPLNFPHHILAVSVGRVVGQGQAEFLLGLLARGLVGGVGQDRLPEFEVEARQPRVEFERLAIRRPRLADGSIPCAPTAR